jgi:general secretion pathway protein J
MTGRSGRGFTLLETLIALAILSLIATLGYRALSALVDSEVQLTAEAQRWRTLDSLFARLEADLRQATPREVRVGAAREAAWFGDVDAEGNTVLRISRAGPEFTSDPGAAGQRVGYLLERETIDVLYWPHLDRTEAAAPERHSLASGLAQFRLRFLDSIGVWRPRWPALGEPALPRAVRIELRLADGTEVERVLALN